MTSNKKSGSGTRMPATRVKTAKGRKISSTLWLQRQLNDPYVVQAKKDGYRSRAAYKLIEMDDKFALLKPGKRILDLGAAPGGWTQVAVARTKADIRTDSSVLGVDILETRAVPGARIMQMDFLAEDAPEKIKEALGGEVHVVLSDMAPNATGHTGTDHIRIIMLCEAAHALALEVLAEGGALIAKVLQGGTENQLLAEMKKHFRSVKHVKPKSSRADSSELYVVATGFRKSGRV